MAELTERTIKISRDLGYRGTDLQTFEREEREREEREREKEKESRKKED